MHDSKIGVENTQNWSIIMANNKIQIGVENTQKTKGDDDDRGFQ